MMEKNLGIFKIDEKYGTYNNGNYNNGNYDNGNYDNANSICGNGVGKNASRNRSYLLRNSYKTVMPSKEFSTDDIIRICSEIAKDENIIVQLPNRKGFFRRSSDVEPPSQRKSSIARKLSLVNGIPCENGNKEVNPESPGINRKISLGNKLSNRHVNKENVPGLKGRNIVAVAILVDDHGVPTKTYTEHDDIPGEEIENAGQIFLSRIPIPFEKEKLRKCSSSSGTENTKALVAVLNDLDEPKRLKLMRKLEKSLSKLYTYDLNTAISFLKTDRYLEVRHEIQAELMLFVNSSLKMTHVRIDFI